MRIFICDDEPEARKKYAIQIECLLKKHDISCTSVTAYDSANQMIMSVDSFAPTDIIFLDINMPQLDGISASQRLRRSNFDGEIIFLTKDECRWHDAFEVGALHYLVKQKCDDELLEKVFLRAVKRIQKRMDQLLLLTSGYESRHIYVSDIQYFEVRKHIMTVYYGNRQNFAFYSQIGRMEEQLISKGFVRPHRSFLVSLYQIAATDKSEITLYNGTVIPIGDTYRKAFKERISSESGILNRSLKHEE